MARGLNKVIPSGQAVLITAPNGEVNASVAILNPNDGVCYLALNNAATAVNWDWKLPSQSYGLFPGPWQSIGIYYVDQSGAGLNGEVSIYSSPQDIVIPDINGIGRALRIGSTELDITEGTIPAVPSSGVLRLWANSSDVLHLLSDVGIDDAIVTRALAEALTNKTFDASSNVLSRIARTTLAADAASFSFANIPQTYNHLLLVQSARNSGTTAGAIDGIRAQINGITTAIYYNERILGLAASASAVETGATTIATIGLIPNALGSSSLYGNGISLLAGYREGSGSRERTIVSLFGALGAFSGGLYIGAMYSHIDTTQAITRLDLIPATGNFVAGSMFDLYGF